MELSEEDLARVMGFSGFNSTKGKFVDDEASHMCGIAGLSKKRKARKMVMKRGTKQQWSVGAQQETE